MLDRFIKNMYWGKAEIYNNKLKNDLSALKESFFLLKFNKQYLLSN